MTTEKIKSLLLMNENKKITVTLLAKKMNVSKATMSRMINTFYEQGLTLDKGKCQLSKKGQEYIEKIQEKSVFNYAPKSIKKFSISFRCNLFVKKQREVLDNDTTNFVILLNHEEYNLLKELLDFYKESGKKINLTDIEFMHIIQAIAPLNWNLKYAVAKDIIAKFISIKYYKDSTDIISLPNYLKGIINNIIKRQKEEVLI
mgnify:CR=1 FL=1